MYSCSSFSHPRIKFPSISFSIQFRRFHGKVSTGGHANRPFFGGPLKLVYDSQVWETLHKAVLEVHLGWEQLEVEHNDSTGKR